MISKLILSSTVLRFENGSNYFQIDKENYLLRVKLKQLGANDSTLEVPIRDITFHVSVNSPHSVGREKSGIYIKTNGKNRTQIADFPNALTLNHIVNHWLKNENPDIDSLNNMFIAANKPIPFVRIWLSVGAIVGVINLIGEYI